MIKKIFNFYFFLFLFIMINRELTFFGFDLRILCLLSALFLIFIAFLSKRKVKFDKKAKLITIFYVIAFASNIMWIFNGLTMDVSSFYVIIFSYIFNFICYLVFIIYSDEITFDKYKNYLFISLFVLILSMLYVMFFGSLDKTFLSTYSGKILDLSPNFLHGEYRISGFAQDPNYTSLFLILGSITALFQYKKNKNKNKKLILFAIIFTYFYLFAASKTVLIAFIPAILLLILPKRLNSIFKKILIPAVIILPLAIIFLDIPVFKDSVTMNQRLAFWNVAKDLFMKSPIIGNGLTSFRSYFSTMPIGWYVQCHSTIFQIISETGIFSLLIFGYLLVMNMNSKSKYVIILTIIYSIFIINTETVYHIYSIFFIGILPLIAKGDNENEEG